MLTDYTAYADIRAALGISDEDLDDATLALPLYGDYLTQELEDISLTLPETYSTIKANGTPSPAELRFLKTCNLFATFAVAKQLTAALPLFAAKQVTDGKAAVQRFDTPYRDTIKNVLEQYDKQRTRLIASLDSIGRSTKAAVTPVYFAAVSPAYDPVTGT